MFVVQVIFCYSLESVEEGRLLVMTIVCVESAVLSMAEGGKERMMERAEERKERRIE